MLLLAGWTDLQSAHTSAHKMPTSVHFELLANHRAAKHLLVYSLGSLPLWITLAEFQVQKQGDIYIKIHT